MYVVYAQIFWPIWILFSSIGHSYIGMVVGIFSVFALWFIAWRIEFKTWRVGE